MSKSIGIFVILGSLGLFGLLKVLNMAVYFKFTLLIFGVGFGIVLLTVLPLLGKMKDLEPEEDVALEPSEEKDSTL